MNNVYSFSVLPVPVYLSSKLKRVIWWTFDISMASVPQPSPLFSLVT